MIKSLLAGVVLAALALPAAAASDLVVKPTSVHLSLSKRTIEVVQVTHLKRGAIEPERTSSCLVEHRTTFSQLVPIVGPTIDQLKAGVKAQREGSCVLWFHAGTARISVPVTIGP